MLDEAFRSMLSDVVRDVVRDELAKHTTTTAGRLMKVDHCAEFLDVSSKTIRRWVKSGELAHHGEGRLMRVDPAEARACLAKHRPEQPEEKAVTVDQGVKRILSTLKRRAH